MQNRSKKFILWFNEVGVEDVEIVGGKNASLGEMYQHLTNKGINVPNGFAVTAHAYKYFIEKSGLKNQIRHILKRLNPKDVKELVEKGKKIRELILGKELPQDLQNEIFEAYQKLSKQYKTANTDVAVRSSATAEDLPEASFAGQQETYLNISGKHELMDSCKNCFASLFTNRAITYREEKGFDHFKVYLSIGVQKMVRSDLASAGVIFTLDTESGFPNVVFVSGSWGLGESVVQGQVNPDEFYVFKPTLETYKPVIKKVLGSKTTKLIYSTEGEHATKKIDTPNTDQQMFCISDTEVLKLAKWAVEIEKHYSKKKGKWTPMDIEWAKDGATKELFIVQARPETVQSQKSRTVLEEYKLLQKGKLLTVGKSVGSKIGQGVAHVIKEAKDIKLFKEGDVLVTEMTDPDWVPAMRMAKAIVTDKGGRTSHAAIVSRELGLPCIVGTSDATKKIRTGQKITVSCAEGEDGKIYDGLLKFKIERRNIANLPKTKTKIMINVGSPEEAFGLSFIPNDGVGLAREEFIINDYIKIHPLALLNYGKLKDADVKKKIDELTIGYKDKSKFFVDKLAEGVATIVAAFWPNPVIVRTSDFKSNEYANLIGGRAFEPKEENPMIGWRGASRYYKEPYVNAFLLECEAFKKVLYQFGLVNLKIMIPMVRTPEEGKKVIDIIEKSGINRKDVDIYAMCEVPSNVILIDEFSKIFDGFSIGSNDLTQLTLGIDRDSELVSHVYDERNEAVLRMLKRAIEGAKKYKKKIGICGQGPSDHPELARFLVECGIDSISLNPDAVIKTKILVANCEKKKRK